MFECPGVQEYMSGTCRLTGQKLTAFVDHLLNQGMQYAVVLRFSLSLDLLLFLLHFPSSIPPIPLNPRPKALKFSQRTLSYRI